MRNYDKYYKISRYLRTNLFECPVIIRRVKMTDDYCGDCSMEKGKFFIRINKKLSENAAIDTLLHEMGHIKSWEKETEFHGTIWGKEYSKIYRAYEKKFLEKETI